MQAYQSWNEGSHWAACQRLILLKSTGHRLMGGFAPSPTRVWGQWMCGLNIKEIRDIPFQRTNVLFSGRFKGFLGFAGVWFFLVEPMMMSVSSDAI